MHATAIPPPVVTSTDRLSLTLFFAVMLHAAVILGVGFSERDDPFERTRSLDIVLVQHSSEEAPDDADFLAQANQEGGGESEEPERPTTPLPTPLVSEEAVPVSASPPAVASEPVPVEEPAPEPPAPPPPAPQAQNVVAQVERPSPQKVERKPEPKPEPKRTPKPEAKPKAQPEQAPTPTQTVSAAALIARTRAMASLSADLDQRLKSYSARPRHKWVTARTREVSYAAYMEAWRAKVEKVGNLNYPDEARRRKLSGSLLLDVSLKPDGTVLEITLRKSSGHKVLDDAAVRIVKLAAPFAPFPESIRKETDILHVERTWQFLSSNRWAAK